MRPLTERTLLHAGVFLITFSGLMFEIGLTRIFSATIWYHFAFVAISVAMLGWGLGGFALHLLRRRLQPSQDAAAVITLLYAAAIPLCLWLIVRFPFHPRRLSFYFAVSVLPFFLAGAALSMVFALHRRRAGQLYFADLLGASTGALAVTLLLSWLGAEGAVLAVAVAPALAAAALSRRVRPFAALGAAALLAALALHATEGAFKIRSAPTKGMYRHLAAQPGARMDLTGWNSYSRIDSLVGFPDVLARLYIDADAWTNLQRWDGRPESLGPLATWYRALPFRLAPGGDTLVVGPGGGTDVLVALASGSPRVTAVELNPLMLRFVRHYGAQAGHLYDHPLVETRLSEGRTYLARTDRRFAVVFLGFVDSWASVASGGLSLSENYLYTTEAFRAYLDHLTDDGLLVIMRWNVDIPRLVANAVELLGARAAAERLAVVIERRGAAGEPPQMIFMLRRRPFTEAEAAEILGWKDALPIVVPGRVVRPPFVDLLAGRQTLASFAASGPERYSPVSDNRPFFFARSKPLGVHGGMLLGFAQILLPVVVLCGALVALGRPRAADRRPYAASVTYFACLGLGFIAVELALLQSLTLLLGHPIFTLSVLLFTLLAAGGIGSYASGRFAVRPVCLTVAGLSVLYAFTLPVVVPALLPLPVAARIVIALALIAPLGFAMGMPFPSGLRRAGRGSLPPPPFYWGLNGIFSVMGSITTMLIAVNLGFCAAMVAGSLCYLGAATAGPRPFRAGEEEEEQAA